MKKTNKKRFIGIALIALCLSLLTFGVYSAKNASLTANGSVGFEAHNCTVNVITTVVGNAPSADSAPSTVATPFITTGQGGAALTDNKLTIGDTADTNEVENLTYNNSTDTESDAYKNRTGAISDLWFSDLQASGLAQQIKINFNVENTSDFAVDVIVTVTLGDNAAEMGVVTNKDTTDVLTGQLAIGATGDFFVTFDLEKTLNRGTEEAPLMDYQDNVEVEYTIKVEFRKFGPGREPVEP